MYRIVLFVAFIRFLVVKLFIERRHSKELITHTDGYTGRSTA